MPRLPVDKCSCTENPLILFTDYSQMNTCREQEPVTSPELKYKHLIPPTDRNAVQVITIQLICLTLAVLMQIHQASLTDSWHGVQRIKTNVT
jgi:hypothetical protein